MTNSSDPIHVIYSDPRDGSVVYPESNGALPVNIQDQTSDVIDLHLTKLIDTVTNDVALNLADTSATITTTGTIPAIGNVLCLKEDHHFYQGEILTVTPVAGNQYTITLDTPVDFAFTTAGGCSVRNQEMNVDGSVTPQIFSISPSGLTAGTKWDVVRMILLMEDATAMDNGTFGGIPALTKGIVIRKVDGDWKNIYNAKTNGDLAAHSFDVIYDDRRSGVGVYGFRCRRTFGGQEKNGVVIRLQADTNDEFQVIIQDNLTGLTKFHVIVQGHIVTN